MQAHTRRAVAFIAGRLISGRPSDTLYDFIAAKHFSFLGEVSATTCAVFGVTQNCHITGSPDSLYPAGNKDTLGLQVQGRTFTGFDFDSGSRFHGTVEAGRVELYDSGSGKTHFYSL